MGTPVDEKRSKLSGTKGVLFCFSPLLKLFVNSLGFQIEGNRTLLQGIIMSLIWEKQILAMTWHVIVHLAWILYQLELGNRRWLLVLHGFVATIVLNGAVYQLSLQMSLKKQTADGKFHLFLKFSLQTQLILFRL